MSQHQLLWFDIFMYFYVFYSGTSWVMIQKALKCILLYWILNLYSLFLRQRACLYDIKKSITKSIRSTQISVQLSFKRNSIFLYGRNKLINDARLQIFSLVGFMWHIGAKMNDIWRYSTRCYWSTKQRKKRKRL